MTISSLSRHAWRHLFTSTVIAGVIVGSGGCTVARPSHVDGDLALILNELDRRPELAERPTPTSAVLLVMRGPNPPPERISDSSFGIGDVYDTAERSTRHLYLGFREVRDWMTTRAPFESFLGRAVEQSLAKRGFTVSEGSLKTDAAADPSSQARESVSPPSRTLVVTLNRIWLDWLSISHIRGDLEASIEVVDSGSQKAVYRRSVILDATVERNHLADWVSRNATETQARTVFHELFVRFQDELFADDELWKSLD
jgi:hypothetical protein